jgi:two-component system, response regulator / RNA-binding antiterminator
MTANWGAPRAGDWRALAIAPVDDDGPDVHVPAPAGDAANGTSSGIYNRAETFQASDAALLVVDTDLVIRDVNAAYLEVTARTYDELLGIPVFEAFPDNPDDPQATGVASASASFERVFRGARRDYLLHRYDIPSRDAPGAFVRKFWTVVNSPLRDKTGHLLGALHHVEDVTTIIESAWGHGPSSLTGLNTDQQTWISLITAFAREALAHQQARTTAQELQHALTSRIVIEQAKGMIAAREGISIDQAFARLRQHARDHNLKLADVADAITRGELHHDLAARIPRRHDPASHESRD